MIPIVPLQSHCIHSGTSWMIPMIQHGTTTIIRSVLAGWERRLRKLYDELSFLRSRLSLSFCAAHVASFPQPLLQCLSGCVYQSSYLSGAILSAIPQSPPTPLSLPHFSSALSRNRLQVFSDGDAVAVERDCHMADARPARSMRALG